METIGFGKDANEETSKGGPLGAQLQPTVAIGHAEVMWSDFTIFKESQKLEFLL